jgi:pantetheine-phosphate adenylyltransferase
MKRALLPGSFDPVTVGHEDLIARAAALFDEVIVCAFVNTQKTYMFSEDERLEFLISVAETYDNVAADLSHSLVTSYAKENGCGVIIKGCRSGMNFEDEYEQALINRELDPDIETLILPASAELSFVSSTMVREMIKYGVDCRQYVPKAIRDKI